MSWTIKKAEHWRTDALELWCWRRLLRVPWRARRSNQSILKEISPEYSLEWLTLDPSEHWGCRADCHPKSGEIRGSLRQKWISASSRPFWNHKLIEYCSGKFGEFLEAEYVLPGERETSRSCRCRGFSHVSGFQLQEPHRFSLWRSEKHLLLAPARRREESSLWNVPRHFLTRSEEAHVWTPVTG